MYEGKEILLLDILKVLQKHTDMNHRLKQIEIIEILERDYGYENLYSRRKTVKNNMDKLLLYSKRNYANEILYDKNERFITDRKTGKKKKANEYFNFGYVHDFTPGELRLIIDSILFSKQIPSSQREELVEKLGDLSSVHFNSRVNHIQTMPTAGPINHELFFNIELLDEAIEQSKKVSFKYTHYTVDEKNNLVLKPRTNDAGLDREYIINPYQMVATNGRYYLICNNDKYDNVSHYRLDRMTGIQVLDEHRKPMRKVKGLEHGLNLPKHMAEHIYMYRGESVSVKLRFHKQVIGEFVDWFGTDHIDFSNQTEDEVTVRVRVNREAMRKWALQYALHVRVLSPDDLVDDIKEDIEQAMKNYE